MLLVFTQEVGSLTGIQHESLMDLNTPLGAVPELCSTTQDNVILYERTLLKNSLQRCGWGLAFNLGHYLNVNTC